ncbi:MAG: redoxin domain-containing protein [Cytophagaceae bacterium]|nr:redoxin domain-containing protein [Cytophagaceae bacterium]
MTYRALQLITLWAGFFFASAAPQLKIGDKAPDITITDPNGKTISLHSLKGKIVMIDFWASWCHPCRMANIEIVPLYQKFNSLGFEIFSVSLDTKKDLWVNAIKNDKLNWSQHGSDLKGWESPIAKTFGIEGLPATFLLDEHGTIIDKDFDDYDLEVRLTSIFFEQINLYPEKASSKIYFTGETKYEIEDMSGKVVLKGKGKEIDISHLPFGDYQVTFDDKTSRFTKIKNSDAPTFYPQRVEDVIHISRKSEFEIYNQRGRLEKKGSTDDTIDVTVLKPGLYYLCLDGHVNLFHKK